MNTIVLVAGHNRAGVWPPHGRDPGAICPFEQTNEHYEAEKVVVQASEILKKEGVSVLVCPFDLNLKGKIKWLNNNFPTASVIEVHFNSFSSPSATGVETWYLSGSKTNVPKNVQQTLVKTLGLKDRGIKGDLENRWDRLGILRDTTTTKDLLIEIGFISNPKDLEAVRKYGHVAIANAAKLLA